GCSRAGAGAAGRGGGCACVPRGGCPAPGNGCGICADTTAAMTRQPSSTNPFRVMSSIMRHVPAFCESRQPWLLETIRALVAREWPTHDKAAVDACGRELAHPLHAIVGRVTTIAESAAG